MNLSNLLGNSSKYVVYVLMALALVFGSHAALDTLVTRYGDSCIPVDADTSVCLVKDDTKTTAE